MNKNVREKAKLLKKQIPAIFLAMKRRDTPLLAKIFALITIAYALSPIDFVPDFVPILGYLDDIIILPLLVTITIKLIPDSILNECQKEAENLWQEGKPKKWYYGIPIIIFWSLIIEAIIYKVVKNISLKSR
ncbi:YkvA family protein [Caldicellulosiruptor naganoensis]|uniref:YkvA family protein n=1 Tax=Caldicellulosiruptor naganoensis TaxID=29324 RepID=A0ABY7BFD9_9FIRM|nr:YkvA family protein [Caldicellulosiruptor naganoensis]WAM31319.1 YkvA family protein [Caldicellulosiruptor naganoensis]